MKIAFISDSGKTIGSMEIDQSIIDSMKDKEGDGIEPKAMEESGDKGGKMSKMFAMKKGESHEESETEEEEATEEGALKVKKPMKQKRPGLF